MRISSPSAMACCWTGVERGSTPAALAALTAAEDEVKASGTTKSSKILASSLPSSASGSNPGSQSQPGTRSHAAAASSPAGTDSKAEAVNGSATSAPFSGPSASASLASSQSADGPAAAAEAAASSSSNSGQIHSSTDTCCSGVSALAESTPASSQPEAGQQWQQWNMPGSHLQEALLHRLRFRRCLMQVRFCWTRAHCICSLCPSVAHRMPPYHAV